MSNLSYDTLRIFCSEDQHSLTRKWLKDFQRDHQGIHVEVLLYNNNIPPGELATEKDGLFLLKEGYSKQIPENYLRIKFARDGIVGIINESNPTCNEFMESGLGIRSLTNIQTGPMKVFICSDSLSTCNLLADHLKYDPDEFRIIKIASVQDMIDSIRLDPVSMGFCCQRYAYHPLTRMEKPGIKIVPLDCNNNGILENKEKFYDNLDELQRAMWTGKYPCHSFLNHYIVAADKPTNQLHIDFIRWILTKGQVQLESEGYVLLRRGILNKEIKKLNTLSVGHTINPIY